MIIYDALIIRAAERNRILTTKTARTALIALIIGAAHQTWAGEPTTSGVEQNGSTQTCVDVQIGGDRSNYLNCLNNNIKQQVEHEQNKPAPASPYDAASPSNQIGGFNENAAQEQMGNAFGVSPHAQRPTQTYVPALGR